MPALDSTLRGQLDKQIVKARDIAETAARAALRALAVDQERPYASMSDTQRRQRNALRAKARQLGSGSQIEGWEPLVEEVAYEQWHRMLFARFLAENHLLMHPTEHVSVTLADCAELAPDEGEPDAWMLAARYASAMLPGIFRVDDPSAQVRFAPEGRAALEAIVQNLPLAVFTADDSLGWVYQFWQTKKKDEVNKSGRKIGGEDLAPVTQLFTEPYMVQFLLQNSLGAWWAARHPNSPLIKQWDYLRFRDDGTPAAGTFPGWPERAAEVTVMDPCCGSGHFLVEAFGMLRLTRMEEEGLTEVAAGDAVIRDNLHGLEIDPRCTQIAAFALAFAAWKAGGYRQLPLPNIACSGIAVRGQLEEWTKLAGDDRNLAIALDRLYHLFRDAPTLGSLINPADVSERDRMFAPEFSRIEQLLDRALAKERGADDLGTLISGAAAEELVRAANLLAHTYTLIVTNVPYLSRAKQADVLKAFCDSDYPQAKRDLATAFVERCRAFVAHDSSYAVVTPQNWLFLAAYKEMRVRILREQCWNFIARLGVGAFETISGEVVNVILAIFTSQLPNESSCMSAIEVSDAKTIVKKQAALCQNDVRQVLQLDQLTNPDMRVTLEKLNKGRLLGDYALGLHGQGSFDDPCYVLNFWQIDQLRPGWILQQTTGKSTEFYDGCTNIFRWEDGHGMLYRYIQAMAAKGYTTGKWKAGRRAWGKRGVAIGGMRNLIVNLYMAESFDTNLAVILPFDASHVQAIWHYCITEDFQNAVRLIDNNIKVSCNTYLKVPFDLEHWQKVADEAGSLPEPYSDNPTQWLFEGNPVGSTEPLQVAIGRLLGYRWPDQKADELDGLADTDGIVCLPAVTGEQPAAERLRALLAAAYGDAWTADERDRLLATVGYAGKGLDLWLRDGFFAQHCKLFHNRPFIWHIWDGRKDGFSALVNYHKLDNARLERLIYTYLGAWIAAQRAQIGDGVGEAEGRLVAALELQRKLEAIRDGEPPYDIFVRWKPLHEQPIGWQPDLNDGVRLNIRPFVTAGVLRSKFTINWNKDRGTNPDGSERLNDRHLTNATKREAHERKLAVND